MAQVKIYNQETNGYYNISFNLKRTILDDTDDGDIDYYITVSTNIPTKTGGTFPTFRIRTMSDTPIGYTTADDFNQLCAWYIEYFTVEAQLANSSSSSSSMGESSSSSMSESSSSSSVGESSSSSSSGGYSESSFGRSSSSSSLGI